ncbi:MAG: hypothetical protein Q8N13_14235 [Acidovorax sp.]|nr:hypothetical protein [Acidovorax sp.]
MNAMKCLVASPPASLLAMAVAANGRVDPREVAELDRLGAYQLIGVDRDCFLELAQVALREIGPSLSETYWLRLIDRSHLLTSLHAIRDPLQRLRVCHLTQAVIRADGEVTGGEQQIYGAMIRHWDLTQAAVAKALVCDHAQP